MHTDIKSRESIVHISVSDMVAEKIRNGIIEGVFKENEKLVETDLCKIMEVSRTPIRKAFEMLIEEGILKRIQGFGVVVACKDIEIGYYLDMLKSLERIAMEKAVDHISPEEIKELIFLQYQLEEMLLDIRKEAEVKEEALQEIYDLDRRFHHMIVKSCGNPLIKQYIETICEKAQVIGFVECSNLDKLFEHRDIIKALEEKSVSKGDMLIKKHFENL